jgi:hypothetical protein
MGQVLLRTALAAVLATAAIPGCKGPAADHAYPNDPLLISYKPIERQAEAAKPVVVVHHEPEVPPLPSEVVASNTASVKNDGPRAREE